MVSSSSVTVHVAAPASVPFKVTVLNQLGAPLPGAAIAVGGGSFLADGSGSAMLNLPQGQNTITAAASGYETATKTVSVSAGELGAIITLQPQTIVVSGGGGGGWPYGLPASVMIVGTYTKVKAEVPLLTWSEYSAVASSLWGARTYWPAPAALYGPIPTGIGDPTYATVEPFGNYADIGEHVNAGSGSYIELGVLGNVRDPDTGQLEQAYVPVLYPSSVTG